jgi:hypothetical protein
MTAEIDGDFVVFLIGMRVNKLWKLHKWVPVFLAMPRMLNELYANPASGFLGSIRTFGVIVQYWRSFEHLEAFARDKDDPHLEVWRNYWKRVGKSTRTGIWHETFLVKAGQYEAIYGNMPPIGLGKAGKLVTVAESRGARERVGAGVGG